MSTSPGMEALRAAVSAVTPEQIEHEQTIERLTQAVGEMAHERSESISHVCNAIQMIAQRHDGLITLIALHYWIHRIMTCSGNRPEAFDISEAARRVAVEAAERSWGGEGEC